MNHIFNIYCFCCLITTKTKSSKKNRKPWICADISGNIRKRQSYYLLFKQVKLAENFYNNFQNKVTDQIGTYTYYTRIIPHKKK